MEGDAAPIAGEKVIHSIWTIWLVFSSLVRREGGRQQMQQHACERQDGQTTLGPQSFRETVLVSPEARHRQRPVTRLRRLLRRWNPDQTGSTTLSTQHIPLSADAKREQGFHARNPKHPEPRAFTAVPMPGEEKWVGEGRQTELRQETEHPKMSWTIFRRHSVTFTFPYPQ